jgi:hypothetical protein
MYANEPSTSGTIDSAASKREVLSTQGRNIILCVYNFLKFVSDEEHVKVDFSRSQDWTSKECNVSVHMMLCICSDDKTSEQHIVMPLSRSLGKHHNVPKCVTNVDDFETDILRRIIFVFYGG